MRGSACLGASVPGKATGKPRSALPRRSLPLCILPLDSATRFVECRKGSSSLPERKHGMILLDKTLQGQHIRNILMRYFWFRKFTDWATIKLCKEIEPVFYGVFNFHNVLKYLLNSSLSELFAKHFWREFTWILHERIRPYRMKERFVYQMCF